MENDVIQRKRYSDKIKPFIGKQIIKVLTGQRRVGKSYVLKQIIEQIWQLDKNANIIYIDMEDLFFDFIKTAEDLNKYIKSKTIDKNKNYVFIDEIQEIKKFEKTMRSLLKNQITNLLCQYKLYSHFCPAALFALLFASKHNSCPPVSDQ